MSSMSGAALRLHRPCVCPKNQGRHRGLPLLGDCGLRKDRSPSSHILFSFFAIRLPSFVIRNGDSRIMVVIGFKPMHNVGQSHCRGNPLWLPKIRAGTGACIGQAQGPAPTFLLFASVQKSVVTKAQAYQQQHPPCRSPGRLKYCGFVP
jgi:hypothetical protein